MMHHILRSIFLIVSTLLIAKKAESIINYSKTYCETLSDFYFNSATNGKILFHTLSRSHKHIFFLFSFIHA